MAETNALSEANSAIFNDVEFSDLVVLIQGRALYCHRVIVCKRCPALRPLIRGSGRDYKIDLVREDARAAHSMLLYLYTFEEPEIFGRYAGTARRGPATIHNASDWTDVHNIYDIALKYNIQLLADAAFAVLLKLAPLMCAKWGVMNDAEKAGRFALIKDIWQKYPDDSTHEFNTEGQEFKTAILTGLAKVADEISGYEGLTRILASKPSFSRDYINALSTEIGRKRKRA